MTAEDRIQTTRRGSQVEERLNESEDGNLGLGVGQDVIDITSTPRVDCPKDASQDSVDPDSSSPSPCSTSEPQTTITNATITSDTIDIDTTSTTPTTNTISQLPRRSTRPLHIPVIPMSTAITAPTLPTSALSELTLHSPSSQLIGTPFASSATLERFEYPFPDTPSPSNSPPPSTSTSSQAVSISPMMDFAAGSNRALAHASIVPPRGMSPTPSSSTTFAFSPHHAHANTNATAYIPSRAATLPYSAASASQSHVHAQAEAPPAGPVYSNYSTYTPAHPKLRAQASAADPPVPPSLARKRRGCNFGLGMVGRRRGATGPMDGDDGERTPLASPNELGK